MRENSLLCNAVFVGVLLLLVGCLALSVASGQQLISAKGYQITPTYDGSNQAVHPDIIYFPDGWNGYRYWMTYTPYPNGDRKYENPSIVASNDGESWEEPLGVKNPLAQPPIEGYNNDPDMIYNCGTDQLWVFFLEGGAGTTHVRLTTSSDGVNWTKSKILFSVPDFQVLSPSVVLKDGTFYMWSVNAASMGCIARNTTVEIRTSVDGESWSDPKTVNVSQPDWVIWHLDVRYILSKNEYWMLFPAYPSGSNCYDTVLFYARSADGRNWVTYDGVAVGKGVNHSWDAGKIYRATFLFDPGTEKIRIWYSAMSKSWRWHIGYMEILYSRFLDGLAQSRG